MTRRLLLRTWGALATLLAVPACAFAGSLGAEPSAADALVIASAQGDLARVTRLVDQRVDVNQTSSSANGALALVQAAANGNTSVINALVRAGARVDAMDGHGQRALIVAAYGGRLSACKLLLAQGAFPTTVAQEAMSPLVAAALAGDAGVVKALVAAGATVHEYDGSGRSPLVVAARAGNVSVVQALLDAAQPSANDVRWHKARLDATAEALRSAHFEIARLLREWK